MALKRRTFLGLLLGAGALLAAPFRRLLALPRQRVRRYPGPVRPLDLDRVRRPGRWLG